MKVFAKIPERELLFSRNQLFHLLWPLVIEQLLSVLVGMADVLMVAYSLSAAGIMNLPAVAEGSCCLSVHR